MTYDFAGGRHGQGIHKLNQPWVFMRSHPAFDVFLNLLDQCL
jgi:hypothetical protein